MNDLISRQAATDAVLDSIPNDEYWRKQVKRAIFSLPPAQQWIPTSERLPEKAGKYLVTVKNGNVYAGTYDKFSGKFQCAATAWMPLPEPYKEDE